MFDAINDTIVAVSSTSGHGVRGIVRLSGPDAIAIAAGLFVADGETCLSRQPGFRRIPGMVLLDAARRLPAEVYLFRAPRSYTRQDCVEIHTIGSPAVLAMVLDGARSAGARLAQPGEFTARAFLGGAMDLSQAEAVAATIGARSDRQLRAARKLQEGDLSRRITRWRARLAEVTALIEADIDFADEPIEFITPGALRAQLSSLARQIEALRAGADSAERFDVLPTVLLIGRPNAGKSSLMNALSGLDRAICSAISGTTRDIVSAPIKLGTTEAMLLDAAGVHEDADALMREAQARVLSAAEHVDLLCLVIDVATPPETSAFECLRSAPTTPCILVANKIDLLDAETRDHRQTILNQAAPANVMSVCAVSATEGTGLEHLRDVLAGQLGHRDDLAEEKSIVLSARQRGCLASASQALGRAIAEAEQIGETVDRAEVLALELREALDALGELIGAVTTEDLLSTIFASFCIGK